MPSNKRSFLRTAILMTLLVVAPAISQTATTVTRAQATLTGLDWPSFGNDLANTRYQNVDQITAANASQLKPAWIFHTGILDAKASFEVSPIVINGTMYVTTGYDDVYALNATSGAEMWGYHALSDGLSPFSQIKICCGLDNRGVAYGNGKL